MKSMRRVLLVSANTCEDPYPVYPLGLGVVAGALRRSGHEVLVLDMALEGRPVSLEQTMARFGPDAVGVSVRNVDNVDSLTAARSWTGDNVRDIVRRVKNVSHAVAVLGGPGFSLMPEELLAHAGADYGITGPGEHALPELLRRLAAGQTPPRILSEGHAPGIIPDASIAPASWEPDILPAYLERGGVPGLHTKRGCPHGCLYCGYPVVEGTRIHHRDPLEVVEDIRQARDRFGVREIFFTDAVFNDARGGYLELAEALAGAGLGVGFGAYFRPSGMNGAEMRLLKRAGLIAAEAGTDGACDAALQSLRKPHSMADVFAFQMLCDDYELPCAHFVIFGGPGETEGTLEEGLANLDRLSGGCVFAFLGLRVHAGTALHRLAVREGALGRDEPLLRPVFYHSLELDRPWAEKRLREAFAARRDRFFPPKEGNLRMRILRRMGYSGLLWNTLPAFAGYARKREAS
jgi:radical SAM superfamily enzyme YgiQ (UPF0313 family)